MNELQIARKQASDYAMAMDALANISQMETEEDAVLGVLHLCKMLFLPKSLLYVSLTDDKNSKIYSLTQLTQKETIIKQRLRTLKNNYSWTDSQKGFLIKIGFGKNDFGVLEVDDVEFPEFIEHYLNLMMSITGVCGLAIENAKRHQLIKETENELRKDKEKLEEALANIKTLRGLLPICMHCKKIRDEKGYWNQLEAYIYKHSDAQFSHSICQDCAKEHYPDLDLYEE